MVDSTAGTADNSIGGDTMVKGKKSTLFDCTANNRSAIEKEKARTGKPMARIINTWLAEHVELTKANQELRDEIAILKAQVRIYEKQ